MGFDSTYINHVQIKGEKIIVTGPLKNLPRYVDLREENNLLKKKISTNQTEITQLKNNNTKEKDLFEKK